MTNTAKLKEAIDFSGLSRDQVAFRLGISTRSLNRKIYNKAEFKASEIGILTDLLDLRDAAAIFFVDEVDLKSPKCIEEITERDKRKKRKLKRKFITRKWHHHIAVIITVFLAFTIISNQNIIMTMQKDTLNTLNNMLLNQESPDQTESDESQGFRKPQID